MHIAMWIIKHTFPIDVLFPHFQFETWTYNYNRTHIYTFSSDTIKCHRNKVEYTNMNPEIAWPEKLPFATKFKLKFSIALSYIVNVVMNNVEVELHIIRDSDLLINYSTSFV